MRRCVCFFCSFLRKVSWRIIIYTPWKFSIFPEELPSQKESTLTKPSFFRGELLNFKGLACAETPSHSETPFRTRSMHLRIVQNYIVTVYKWVSQPQRNPKIRNFRLSISCHVSFVFFFGFVSLFLLKQNKLGDLSVRDWTDHQGHVIFFRQFLACGMIHVSTLLSQQPIGARDSRNPFFFEETCFWQSETSFLTPQDSSLAFLPAFVQTHFYISLYVTNCC